MKGEERYYKIRTDEDPNIVGSASFEVERFVGEIRVVAVELRSKEELSHLFKSEINVK